VAVRRSLITRLRHDALPCPARGLELVVYPLATAHAAGGGPGFVLELNDGPAMPYRAALDPSERSADAGGFWYVVDRAILRSAGRRLHGPPATELVAEPAHCDLLAALTTSLAWHRTAEAGQRRNTVLNACRAWRWVEEGIWTAKPDAGRWALAHGVGFVRAAVAAALEARPIDAEAAAAVLDEVQEVLRRAASTT
jgi:hypothetical protein